MGSGEGKLMSEKFTKKQIERAMQSAAKARQEAAEATGQHGQMVKEFVEKHGVERKAFTWARNLYEAAEDKRQMVIRDFLDICKELGFLDQQDMFDNLDDRVVPLNAKGQTVEEATAEELAGDDPAERAQSAA